MVCWWMGRRGLGSVTPSCFPMCRFSFCVIWSSQLLYILLIILVLLTVLLTGWRSKVEKSSSGPSFHHKTRTKIKIGSKRKGGTGHTYNNKRLRSYRVILQDQQFVKNVADFHSHWTVVHQTVNLWRQRKNKRRGQNSKSYIMRWRRASCLMMPTYSQDKVGVGEV